MSSLHERIEARGPAEQHGVRPRQSSRQSRQLPGTVRVISGSEFRRKIGVGKDTFAAMVKSGRVRHLLSVNLSTARRPVYVLAKVEAWISETPDALRASRPHGTR